jgi:hypothetical protein
MYWGDLPGQLLWWRDRQRKRHDAEREGLKT